MSKNKRRDRPLREPREKRVCRAIRLLAAGQSLEDVAQAVHVQPQTLATWMQWEDFRLLAACVAEYAALADLADLTPEALQAYRRALAGTDDELAVRAARDVLDRAERLIQRQQPSAAPSEQVIVVEYVNPEGQTASTPPWADPHSPAPGALQGGRVRPPLRENGDGQDSAD
jgi:hypothetical protein